MALLNKTGTAKWILEALRHYTCVDRYPNTPLNTPCEFVCLLETDRTLPDTSDDLMWN